LLLLIIHWQNGAVPLEIAAQNGHAETVQILLEARANVNHQNKTGCTALFAAALMGHSEVVKLLLEAGASDIPTKFGDTALSQAEANNDRNMRRLLLQYGN
jgi:ankyrin repeat protein